MSEQVLTPERLREALLVIAADYARTHRTLDEWHILDKKERRQKLEARREYIFQTLDSLFDLVDELECFDRGVVY